MKKSIIAFAVVTAIAGTASAQSAATLYGKIDMGYGLGNGGEFETQPGQVNKKFQQLGNSKYYSRWGLKGAEDLGNGMKIFFQLESQINPETGASNSKIFDRTAIVGLSGPFGSVQAGRQTTLHFRIMGQFDAAGGPNMASSIGNVGLSAPQRLGGPRFRPLPRLDSALSYSSPNFSGFQFHGLMTLKNDAYVAKNVYAAAATYKYSDLTVGASFESKLSDQMSASWGLGAKYNFGSFILSGGYFDNHQKIDGKGFYAGVAVPIKSWAVGAQVAYNTDAYRWNNTERLKPLSFEIFTSYNLSKRTQLYTQWSYMNNDAKTFMAADRRHSASVGIIHDF